MAARKPLTDVSTPCTVQILDARTQTLRPALLIREGRKSKGERMFTAVMRCPRTHQATVRKIRMPLSQIFSDVIIMRGKPVPGTSLSIVKRCAKILHALGKSSWAQYNKDAREELLALLRPAQVSA